jgi:hypothetical protein
MGRVILTYKSDKTESLKCKSKERAEEIAKKRPNVIKWNFYADNERVPQKKREELPMPQSFEELDQMIRQKGTFY